MPSYRLTLLFLPLIAARVWAGEADPFAGVTEKAAAQPQVHESWTRSCFHDTFGLNLQTDTHGTILQLSNEKNFGFERDWYTGLWGIISEDFNYDAYYLAGSGYDLKYKGQSGLAAARLSLSNKYSSENGIEGGL